MSDLFLALLLSSIFILLWIVVFKSYSTVDNVPRKLLLKSLSFGIVLALCALLVEQYLLFLFDREFFQFYPTISQSRSEEFIYNIVFTFFLAVLIEESLKFFTLKKLIEGNQTKRVIEGMKAGLYLGLGFALIENAFYFYSFFFEFGGKDLYTLIMIRGFIVTLAHGLYGIIAGYYISLNKFHKLYQPFFLKKGFITCILFHGMFNFFLIINLSYLSFFTMILLLTLVLIWYDDRANFQPLVRQGKVPHKPFLSESHEIEVMTAILMPPKELFTKILKIFTIK